MLVEQFYDKIERGAEMIEDRIDLIPRQNDGDVGFYLRACDAIHLAEILLQHVPKKEQ